MAYNTELISGESRSRQTEQREQRPGIRDRQGQLDSLWSAFPGLGFYWAGIGVRGDRKEGLGQVEDSQGAAGKDSE